MREIKFRALKDDMSNYNFVYGSLIYNNEIPRIQENVSNRLFSTCVKGTEGQFIGLKDENRVEIYNGDILKISQIDDYSGKEIITIDYISYFKKIASFRLTKNPKYLFFSYADEFEVIGNIHENKDLL